MASLFHTLKEDKQTDCGRNNGQEWESPGKKRMEAKKEKKREQREQNQRATG